MGIVTSSSSSAGRARRCSRSAVDEPQHMSLLDATASRDCPVSLGRMPRNSAEVGDRDGSAKALERNVLLSRPCSLAMSRSPTRRSEASSTRARWQQLTLRRRPVRWSRPICGSVSRSASQLVGGSTDGRLVGGRWVRRENTPRSVGWSAVGCSQKSLTRANRTR